jgi:hypothetical protein
LTSPQFFRQNPNFNNPLLIQPHAPIINQPQVPIPQQMSILQQVQFQNHPNLIPELPGPLTHFQNIPSVSSNVDNDSYNNLSSPTSSPSIEKELPHTPSSSQLSPIIYTNIKDQKDIGSPFNN